MTHIHVTFVTFVIENLGSQKTIADESSHPNRHIIGINAQDAAPHCIVPAAQGQIARRLAQGPGQARLGLELHQGVYAGENIPQPVLLPHG